MVVRQCGGIEIMDKDPLPQLITVIEDSRRTAVLPFTQGKGMGFDFSRSDMGYLRSGFH